ncbi:MAG: hypothetical protein J6C22_18220 [Bacteroides sp.]|nr:hypothetical protein [Bacteroides sp.]
MADIVTSLHLEYNSIANGGELLLVAMTAVKRYLDGKPTDENDYRCTVVAPKNGFMRYDVIVQNKPEIVLTNGDAIPVAFDGLVLKLYRTWRENASGGYALSAKATAVRPVAKKQ